MNLLDPFTFFSQMRRDPADKLIKYITLYSLLEFFNLGNRSEF